ncbi:hypothetical protein [Sphingobium aromaticiconvertens]|uniref:hypothetical protein n=1 Tax=Sphingobium aromaticiconvertens TaxID=365341 RepID=UPI00301949BA
MKTLVLTILALVSTSMPVMAQDIAPAIDPIENARGLHQRSIMGAHAKRARQGGTATAGKPRPGTTAFQQQACANRPQYRKQYGVDHPQVQKLESLCAQAGY